MIYLTHTIIFSQPMGENMEQCQQTKKYAVSMLLSLAETKPNPTIAPRYLPKLQPTRTLYCMWSETDPSLKQ